MSKPTTSRTNANKQLVTTALFAAVITVVTAYLFHIPFPTGYIHLGDAVIYLAACILPLPYAIAAAAIGAGLADLLTFPIWVLPTVVIKALIILPFTSKHEKLLCKRNVFATILACFLSPTLYALVAIPLTGTVSSFMPQFIGTLIQAVGSGVIFLIIGTVLDANKVKAQLLKI